VAVPSEQIAYFLQSEFCTARIEIPSASFGHMMQFALGEQFPIKNQSLTFIRLLLIKMCLPVSESKNIPSAHW
jgi:hypothetical protein